MNPNTSGQGYSSQLGLNSATGKFNVDVTIIKQMLGRVRTATLVKIVSCTNDGGVSPIGFVDATPLVFAVDGIFNTYPHGTIHNFCYVRVQGGSNAIIMDPQPGDIGLAVICDRDISVIKNTVKEGPPGSRRRFDLTDGVYCFSVLSPGGAPQQYWRFSTAGIDAHDSNGNTIVMDAAGVHINGVLFDRNKNVSAVADLTATGNTSFGGGAQEVKLADGSSATKTRAT
jgi:hypothetical protein